ncbi:50S ribosomal protein L28 [bacterium (Candidatus Moisslbacteria) CG12_big_fil_rev_8_21_14_0_65_36_11]|nr:50S ribosomal protein L28 [Candidatus Kuenenbacteria bacterium]PIV45927.1 MAG: 50S ribosomal protein L28 [bacterium (Candidatus Moisslbacteria) CG02_land_8_20_14_3_00_36_53]PIW68053.1 MAG: 50S ribosomal protein L28 [bacterium (Candidatus Moisslbacteria) CG12_big_fil_rev_8_21_14_0_65_36_11]PIZ90187.1 MAG: 50S ribosomal protein L28 [bacterium (Candidatus Moisslbacteria) CG_4_10_14_0_2_um_filter_36_61]PJC00772.1 MAG: 50S ribosomal protein L28 [bacterium (Candidatus Moisslbacteria) CG_4_9_14_0_8
MSKFCELCGRIPQTSQKRSHSNIATKRRQNLNLQLIKIDRKKLRVCARCLKKIKKEKSN